MQWRLMLSATYCNHISYVPWLLNKNHWWLLSINVITLDLAHSNLVKRPIYKIFEFSFSERWQYYIQRGHARAGPEARPSGQALGLRTGRSLKSLTILKSLTNLKSLTDLKEHFNEDFFVTKKVINWWDISREQ